MRYQANIKWISHVLCLTLAGRWNIHMKRRKALASVHARTQFVWQCDLEQVGTGTLKPRSMNTKPWFLMCSSRCSKAFDIFGPAKPGVDIFGPAKARSSAHFAQFWAVTVTHTHTSIYGIGHHVGSRKSTDATDVCLLTCFLPDICKFYMQSVISVISSCPWIVPQELHNCRWHICHGPSSCHGRVNSENSCAPWSCSRCCGQRFHSRRFLDFLLFCHVLSICKLQDTIFNHVHTL